MQYATPRSPPPTWAAVLGPAQGRPEEYWAALFARTYVAELRVETGDRSAGIVAADRERYAGCCPWRWQAAGLRFESLPDGSVQPQFAAAAHRRRLRQLGPGDSAAASH